jgi:hypothetical protein
LGTGVATFLGTPSSANLAAAVTDETGTGALVFANSPTLVTPALGTPASGVVTNLTGTASININGTVGATTASTGAFTTLSATGVTTVQAGTAAAPAITTSGDTNTGIFFPAADTIAFAEGGVEAMRLDASGNLGLGVTPTGTSKFEVYTGNTVLNGVTSRFNGSNPPIALASTTSNGFPYLGFNTVQIVSSDNQTYAVNGFASRISHVQGGTGGFQFNVAPSGTAGNAISFSQVMTLDASGDFLLGTTSAPANGANARNVVFNNPNSVATLVKVSNAVTGNTASDGFDLIMGTSSDAYLVNRENGPMIFATNAAESARITSGGEVLVGLTSATGVALLQVSGAIRTTGFTVATLPAGTVGMRTYVTDALAPSFGVAVAGSGAVTIPVFYDGANWIVA